MSDTLADLCEDIVDCPHSTPVWTDEGPVVLRSHNIRSGRLVLDDVSHTDEAHFADRTRRATPRAGDLVITREAPMGEVARIPAGLRCCLGQRMVLLRPNLARVDSGFLLYALQSRAVQHQIRAHDGTGSTVSNLRIPDLARLRLDVPSIDDQRRIAGILGALDDKIWLNRRVAATLSHLAQTSFDSLLAGAEAGDWPEGRIVDVADLNPESWPANALPESIQYVDLGGVKAGRVDQIATLPRSDAPSRAQRVLRPGDTILGTVRPGNRSYALIADRGLTGSTGFAQLRPKDPRDAAFVYLAATSDENIARLTRLADGGAYPAVRPGVVAETEIPIPPRALLEIFARRVQPLLDRQAIAEAESRTLTALRDTLLPRLLDGSLVDQAMQVAS